MTHPARTRVCSFAASTLTCALLASPAWADPPQINNVQPYGVQRGTATEVTFQGANLAGNPRLIAPVPVVVEPPSEPKRGRRELGREADG